jgi:hypothetical protein
MEEFIENENSLRFVDVFVEQLELDNLGFEIATLKKSLMSKPAILAFGFVHFKYGINGRTVSQMSIKLCSC